MPWSMTSGGRYLLAITVVFFTLSLFLAVGNAVVSMPHDESPDPVNYITGAEDLGS